MEKFSRRKMIKSVALTTIATQVACTQESCLEEIAEDKFLDGMYTALTGHSASKVLQEIRLAKKKGTLGPIAPVPPNRMIPLPNGGISDSAGGLPPPVPIPGRPAEDPTARAFYLLDDLGDAEVDGRVIALAVSDSSAAQRGSVTLRQSIPGGSTLSLRDIALSADGQTLVVSQAGSPPQWIFIDTAALTIAGRLMAPAGVFPRRCVFAPDGKVAYAVASGFQFDRNPQPLSVHILDTATRTIVDTIGVPANTLIDDWTITPDQGLLFGVGGRLLHVFDVATRTHSGSFDIVAPIGGTQGVSGSVHRLAMHPRGDRLYAVITRFPVDSPQAAAVAVIDVRSARKIKEMPLRYPTGVIGGRIGISPNGSLLLAGFQRAAEVQAFDLDHSLELEPIVLGADFGFSTLAMA